MLALAVSLLFAVAAFAAVSVIRSALLVGSARARLVLAELGEIERRARVIRAPSGHSRPALQPELAAA